jgi:hypothetical protein
MRLCAAVIELGDIIVRAFTAYPKGGTRDLLAFFSRVAPRDATVGVLRRGAEVKISAYGSAGYRWIARSWHAISCVCFLALCFCGNTSITIFLHSFRDAPGPESLCG